MVTSRIFPALNLPACVYIVTGVSSTTPTAVRLEFPPFKVTRLVPAAFIPHQTWTFLVAHIRWVYTRNRRTAAKTAALLMIRTQSHGQLPLLLLAIPHTLAILHIRVIPRTQATRRILHTLATHRTQATRRILHTLVMAVHHLLQLVSLPRVQRLEQWQRFRGMLLPAQARIIFVPIFLATLGMGNVMARKLPVISAMIMSDLLRFG